MHNATGIILAGGHSRRMGWDKAFLSVDDKPLIEMTIAKMLGLFKDVMVITNSPLSYEKYKHQVIIKEDIIPQCGPLGGIYTALASSNHRYNFIMACDMPFLNVNLLSHMFERMEESEAVVCEYGDTLHPLFAIYDKSCALAVEKQVLQQNLKMKDFLKHIRATILSEPEVKEFDFDGLSFTNINTHKEYQSYCQRRKKIDYMRISVTDRCNLRCNYCMPKEGVSPQPHDTILTFEEIARLVKIFASLGGGKVRLTGGDPLVRKGIVNLVEDLKKIEGLREICLTTNGVLLASFAENLKRAGINRINISLDTLKRERFKAITGSDSLDNVIQGIGKVNALGFPSTKLNVVVMKGVNDDEIVDFMNFSRERKLTLRFIEFMKTTPLWQERYFVPTERIKEICQKNFHLQKTKYKSSGPAEYYEFDNGLVGFIKTSQENCDACGRLRLTSTGELKTCLYQSQGISLRNLLRENSKDREIRNIVKSIMAFKDDIDYSKWGKPENYMCSIGG